MRIRSLLVMGCVLAVSTSSVAVAAPRPAAKPKPKPICNMVVDPATDARAPYDPSLDIVSVDVANNATTLTVVIRVAKMSATDQMAPTGRYYSVSFVYRSTGTGSEKISALLTPTGDSWDTGNGTGVVDLAKNEIRISVPIGRLAGHPLFGPNEALTNVLATSDLAIPAASLPVQTGSFPAGLWLESVDSATSDRAYPVGAPSCVKVGA